MGEQDLELIILSAKRQFILFRESIFHCTAAVDPKKKKHGGPSTSEVLDIMKTCNLETTQKQKCGF